MSGDWLATALAWWVTLWIHSFVLAAGVWCYHRWFRAGREQVEGLWKMALLGGVLTASLQTAFGSPGAALWTLSSPASRESLARLESPTPPTSRSPDRAEPAFPMSPGAPSADAPSSGAPSSGSTTSANATPSAEATEGAKSRAERSRGDRAGGRQGDPSLALAPGPAAPSPSTPSAGSFRGHESNAGAPQGPESSAGVPPGFDPRPRGPFAQLSLGVLLLALLGFAMLLRVVWRWGCASRGIRRLLRHRRPLEDATIRGELDRLAARAGFSEPIRLSVAPGLQVPLSLGLWRGEIVLPERALRDMDARRLRPVLAHELSHVIRRDGLWLRLHLLARVLVGLQPLHGLVVRRLRALSERACDERAAKLCGSRLAVASSLTEVAGWLSPASPSNRLACSVVENRVELVDRVERMLGAAPPAVRSELRTTLAAVALAVAATLTPGLAARSPETERGPLDAKVSHEAATEATTEAATRLAWDEWTRLAHEIKTLRIEAAQRRDIPDVARSLRNIAQRERAVHRLLEDLFPRSAGQKRSAPPSPGVPFSNQFEVQR